MALLDQRRTVRFAGPDLIVRNKDFTIYAPVYVDAALVAPVSGTVTIYDSSNTKIVDGAAATITADIAQYIVAAGTTDGLTLEMGWRVEWALTMTALPPDIIDAQNDAALVRRELFPVVTDADIIRRVPALDPSRTGVVSDATNYQDQLDEAFTMISLRLIRLGNRPNLIMEPSALREAHLALTVALIFEGRLASQLQGAWQEAAAKWFERYEVAFSQLNPRYAQYDDEQADSRRKPGQPTVFLNGGFRQTWPWLGPFRGRR